MRVAFDIDNVICATIEGALSIVAQDLGITTDKLSLTGIYGNPISSDDPSIAERINLSHQFWDRADLLSTCPPLEGSIEALWKLYSRGALHAYITRRPPQVEQLTLDWLATQGAPEVPTYFVGTTDAHTTFSTCKAELCVQIGATHLIDDHAHELTAAIQKGITPIAVDAPVGLAHRIEALKPYPSITIVPSAAAAVASLLRGHQWAA